MLRVGLTGGLGSGKSAVALVFADQGAHVLEADAIGRALMQPGEEVYSAIVGHFGDDVVSRTGQLDRTVLAALAFEHGRLPELNRIVHPAVIRAQQQRIDELAREDPDGMVVVESALVFEVSAGPDVPGWRERFDRMVLVTAPEELKVARYVERVLVADGSEETRARAAADARRRLAAQIPDSEKLPLCDFVIENNRTLVLLRRRALEVFAQLRAGAGILLK
jgi:dephospho-CoA kinase